MRCHFSWVFLAGVKSAKGDFRVERIKKFEMGKGDFILGERVIYFGVYLPCNDTFNRKTMRQLKKLGAQFNVPWNKQCFFYCNAIKMTRKEEKRRW